MEPSSLSSIWKTDPWPMPKRALNVPNFGLFDGRMGQILEPARKPATGSAFLGPEVCKSTLRKPSIWSELPLMNKPVPVQRPSSICSSSSDSDYSTSPASNWSSDLIALASVEKAFKNLTMAEELNQSKRPGPKPEVISKRLHVSNIPFKFRDTDLAKLFENFGTILETEIIFNERGSKGFGFVTMMHREEALLARYHLNGALVAGRVIEVNDALPKMKLTEKPQVNTTVNQWKVTYAPNIKYMPPTAVFQRDSKKFRTLF
ncbi:RNA binding protein fox-1 -like protein 1 [Halotydeus destructor]|nr:RNA binding protein fox-1 -like protein 1 [Halotydeus destructor]